jgi:hypothetical protein
MRLTLQQWRRLDDWLSEGGEGLPQDVVKAWDAMCDAEDKAEEADEALDEARDAYDKAVGNHAGELEALLKGE